MNDLDAKISDVFGLLAVLLVFVIAYFSAIFPIADQLIEQDMSNKRESEKDALVARLGSYRWLTLGFLSLTVLVGLVVAPLSQEVIAAWSWHWPMSATRTGLLLVDVCLIGMVAAGMWLVWRLSRGIRNAKTPLPIPAPIGGDTQ